MGRVFDRVYWHRGGATSARVRTYDDDESVDFPRTLRARICRDGSLICLFDSFKCNHTEAAKERDVYML